MSVHGWSGRALTAALALALLSIAAPAQAAPADPGGKVAPDLRAQLTSGRTTTFWAVLRDKADLGPARRAAGKERNARVYRAKTELAARSQAGLRAMLKARKASFTPYWIANTVRVTGDADLAAAVAARPEVSRVLADKVVPLPKAIPASALPAVRNGTQTLEWNLDKIHTPRVWDEFADRGEGIVVANVDTGVQWDHPALAAGYRGRAADGTVNHDYSWFDPTGLCADGVPCDNAGHGTHTMGTMVGLDGDHAYGVAPGAKWIAAKGCETNGCSTASLLAAGQWIVAPTDRAGNNPRPDLAPDVVNNSWGGWGFDPWYSQIVDAWVAAGIFPAFSNGNAGPGCASAGSPGNYTAAYASGAYDSAGTVASFSSRGSGQDGTIKPNIAAPGVDVLSSVPGGGYASLSGTSMASPHTAATVALLWSAVPALRRDVATTRQVLDVTAEDVDDTSCGGTAADNNVYGEGRLDAYAAVAGARQPSGTLAGTVTAEGTPAAGVTVAVSGPVSRQSTTGADGAYRLALLPPGTYQITATKYGFRNATGTVEVKAGESERFDIALEQAPTATLSGTITDAQGPVSDATVALTNTPATTSTDSEGRFRLTAPVGRYELTITPPGGCDAVQTRTVDLSEDTTLNIRLARRWDAYGYSCARTTGGYVEGTDRVELSNSDDASAELQLPFPVWFYGRYQQQAWVSSNGQITFSGPETAYNNVAIPDPLPPNNAISAFWDDLYVDEEAGIYTATVGDRFVVEWRNIRFYADASQRLSISAEISRDGTIALHYRGLQGALASGGSATIGIENVDGTDGLQYTFGASALTDGGGVTFRPPSVP
ncbi:S8 family serine peptidase [Actinoplanes sp. NPDC049548]|uniref:S8 family serine peptidase n=1 Tax=Actinoplanes sp. NPDC049548 TaxID=3155152 RepID=UPI00343C2F6A